MKNITPEMANKIANSIEELEDIIGPLYVTLEWPDYQEFLGDDDVAFDEDADFLLVPAKHYINKIMKR